jgi:hypothetical protein
MNQRFIQVVSIILWQSLLAGMEDVLRKPVGDIIDTQEAANSLARVEPQPGTGHHASRRFMSADSFVAFYLVSNPFWKILHPKLLIEVVAAGIDPKASPTS